MAVRFTAESQTYSRALGLGSRSIYTMCLWAKISVDRNTWVSPLCIDAGTSADSTSFETAVDGTAYAVNFDNSGSTNLFSATVGTWYFMALVQNGTSTTVYYKAEGASTLTVVTDTNTLSPVVLSNLRIGRWAGTGEWFNGAVSGVKLWTAALSAAEVAAEAGQLMHVRTAGLVGSYPLQVAETTDYSGNGNTLSGGTGATTETGPSVPLSGSGAPTVGAGADASHTTNTVFSRTATENDNGSAITSRAWTIQTGTGTPANPGELLHIGPAAGQNHFNVGIGGDGGAPHVDHTQADIAAGYTEDPNFRLTSDSSAVQFRVRVDAGTTSGSTYPRSELREYQLNGTSLAAWNAASGTHYMEGRSKVTHVAATKPWVCIAQIHGPSDDALRIQTEIVSSQLALCVRYTATGGTEVRTVLLPSYTVGTPIDWRIDCVNGAASVTINGTTTNLSGALTDTGCYFKAGCYAQSNTSTEGGDNTQFFTVELSNLEVWHTGYATPTTPSWGSSTVIGTAAALSWTPTVAGTYLLRYSATNAIGTGFDEATITVSGGAAPTVSAGADATGTVGTLFSRTATENDNGSAITSRGWVIVSGPAGVGNSNTTLGFSYTPTVAGTYVFRYSATNAVGTTTDDMTLTVTGGATGASPTVREFLITTGTGNVSVTTGAGTQVGDLLVAFHQTAFRASTDLVAPTPNPASPNSWQTIDTAQASGTGTVRMRAWFRRVTAAGAQTVTMAPPGATNTNGLALYVVAGADDTDPIDGSDNAIGTAQPQPVGPVTTTAIKTRILAAWGAYNGTVAYTAAPTGLSMAAGAGGTQKLASSTNNALMAASGERTVSGATPVYEPTSTGTPTSWASVAVAIQGPTATAPTVDAGGSAAIDQYETLNRTATENSNGATITARSWTVVSGPNQVGATLSTTAVLAWAPTVAGTYALRYSATNLAGTTTDDITVTVAALIFPVTAALRLAANRTVARRSSGAVAAPLHLAANRAGAKRASVAPTAPLTLGASALGRKFNLVTAPLRLAAALSSAGSSNGAFVTAALKLGAATAGNAHHSGAGVETAPLTLVAVTAGTSLRSGDVSAPLALVAAPGAGAKRATASPAAPVVLTATISGVLHGGRATPVALLALGASASGRSTTRSGYAVTAILRLAARTTTTGTRSGSSVNARLRLFAVGNTERIVSEVLAIRPRADTTTKYELVAVARVPQVSGPPIFLEVDPIDWTSIAHTEALNTAPSLSVDVKIEKLTEPVLQRLRTPHELPTELWLNRNGKRVFAGPLATGRVSGDSLSLEAQGIESYFRMWHVEQDLTFTNVDQFLIVAELINQWQRLEYGNYGIDTSQVGASGVLRTIAYAAAELHKVDERIADFTKLADGFDLTIDPSSRMLELHSPSRGIDRSTGEDAIVFDSRNVTSSDVAFSIAPGDLASDGLGTATASGSDAPLLARFANEELRAKFGRVGITGTFQTADQGALDAAIQEMVGARSEVLLVPGPNARVTIDADLSAYDVGDIIGYQAHSRLSASGAYRIRKRMIRVAATGTESVSLEFV